ncbi:MAG: DUF7948 domain-containing protein, partial [Candidatus Heimdallarchaeota archaeon]
MKSKSQISKLIILCLLFFFIINFQTYYDNEANLSISYKENLLQDSNGSFIENLGQLSNKDVIYYSQIAGGKIGFCKNKIVINLGNNLLSLTFDAANIVIPIALNKQITKSNYFLGDRGTYSNVRHFETIVYYNLWQGIDLYYFTTPQGLKYEFVVHPGANVKNIRIICDGFDSLTVSDNQIIISGLLYSFTDEGLVVYQEDSKSIPAKFASISSNIYGFDIGEYDRNQKLIIDPIIYSTFLGGVGDETAEVIKLDGSGNIYVCGYTTSSDFPVENGYDSSYNSGYDVFVSKFSSSGSLIYSTFVGGSSDEYAYDLALDSSNNVYVTGTTWSSDFPDVNAYQSGKDLGSDCFAFKLSSDGSTLVYSTYLGGDWNDAGRGIAVNTTGHAHVVGETYSSDFPLANDLSMSITDDDNCILFVLSPSGNSLPFSTLIGGNGVEAANAIVLDSNIAFITGRTSSSDLATSGSYQESNNGGTECFVAKVDLASPSLVFATFVGGANFDVGLDIVVDNAGSIYVAGFTDGDFPTVSAYDSSYNSNRDAFVLKMQNDGTDLIYSTYLGGDEVDVVYGLAINPTSGVVYVTGSTESDNF